MGGAAVLEPGTLEAAGTGEEEDRHGWGPQTPAQGQLTAIWPWVSHTLHDFFYLNNRNINSYSFFFFFFFFFFFLRIRINFGVHWAYIWRNESRYNHTIFFLKQIIRFTLNLLIRNTFDGNPDFQNVSIQRKYSMLSIQRGHNPRGFQPHQRYCRSVYLWHTPPPECGRKALL